ncbi:hypothetical protein RSAG8_08439, partial [Rhizoctonia solani AG-8 WAC10335]
MRYLTICGICHDGVTLELENQPRMSEIPTTVDISSTAVDHHKSIYGKVDDMQSHPTPLRVAIKGFFVGLSGKKRM